MSGSSELQALLASLRRNGVRIEGVPGTSPIVVPARTAGGPAAELDLPEELIGDYLDHLGASYAPFDDDPRGTARELLAVDLAQQLTADHDRGVNRVRRLALVDDERGLRFLEERTDDPGPRPVAGDEPHDDPRAFAAELDALASYLRDQGLDTVADHSAGSLRVQRPGNDEPATVELRPDLYRRHLEQSEEEFEAIGGDPLEHAWRSWCRAVLSALVVDLPFSRLSFVVTPAGDVGLAPDAEGTEPPKPRYRWTAERPPGWTSGP